MFPNALISFDNFLVHLVCQDLAFNIDRQETIVWNDFGPMPIPLYSVTVLYPQKIQERARSTPHSGSGRLNTCNICHAAVTRQPLTTPSHYIAERLNFNSGMIAHVSKDRQSEFLKKQLLNITSQC